MSQPRLLFWPLSRASTSCSTPSTPSAAPSAPSHAHLPCSTSIRVCMTPRTVTSVWGRTWQQQRSLEQGSAVHEGEEGCGGGGAGVGQQAEQVRVELGKDVAEIAQLGGGGEEPTGQGQVIQCCRQCPVCNAQGQDLQHLHPPPSESESEPAQGQQQHRCQHAHKMAQHRPGSDQCQQHLRAPHTAPPLHGQQLLHQQHYKHAPVQARGGRGGGGRGLLGEPVLVLPCVEGRVQGVLQQGVQGALHQHRIWLQLQRWL